MDQDSPPSIFVVVINNKTASGVSLYQQFIGPLLKHDGNKLDSTVDYRLCFFQRRNISIRHSYTIMAKW